MSDWTKLVTTTYKKNHKKNSSYKFKDALKDAGKIYKKGGVNSTNKKMKSHKKMRKNTGTRKMRK
jgi:hypothetical protein